MATYLTGNTIRTLREKKGCTQRELAATLGVTDKAVSKCETGKGNSPDIASDRSRWRRPSAYSGGRAALRGSAPSTATVSANMLKTAFYVCPVRGNVVHATGEGSFSCCGITLPVQEPEDADQADEMHLVTVEQIDNDRYVRLPNHPMTKQHYVSFIAFVTTDTVRLRKLYPEQEAEARFPLAGSGALYAYCNQHGLFRIRVRAAAPGRPRPGRS